jgi:DNA-binding PadR family transcriptional regulator
MIICALYIIERFPGDFMFQLTKAEWENLTFHFGISSKQHGGRRFRPYAFTEQGVAMLASVLNSPKAIIVNINIMRAFVELRHYVFSQNKDDQIAELRKLLMLYIEKNDKRVNEIIIALNNLIEQPPKTKRIGFNTDNK